MYAEAIPLTICFNSTLLRLTRKVKLIGPESLMLDKQWD